MNELKVGLINHQISPNNDEWVWKNNEDKSFTVKGVRESLAQQINLNTVASDFVWNRWATNKSIMFVWRVVKNRIPTANALKRRGMILNDYNCKICGASEETADHVLIQCSFAEQIWSEVFAWLKIQVAYRNVTIQQLMQEINEIQRSRNVTKAIHTVVIQTSWKLWRVRNAKIFENKASAIQTTVEQIKEESFYCISKRSKFKEISRQEWWEFKCRM
ncbi:uncharacterized protein LOC110907357 [Helianthus annuus]|uniref:uncharacterized protein LOC110907357 n=1 Tax=Helianthus annuus TaxID=4232 RepID=UPI000B8F445D|nr:uncharacterized protein LOC110907357 [Helianthus annuus]